ncbi:hypothetical protein RvY_11386-1 [Ramazzottius varieornatus]|uniref:Uncharacterized protein n=1 Tax=Ramazzottius varieornatus TaxID=947166 RepID=A0A1D1VID4_RAMVA|nr:hypothetical protein RvY_11386-1 [Ramazzottius varieornatus]
MAHALPISVLGNLLDDNSFRISVGLRLGARLCEPHVCRCEKLVDELGHHGLSCQLSAGRHSRHSPLNDSLHRALISCRVPNVLELNGILRDDQKRLDGLTLIPWQQGKALVWDVTCVDTLAETYLRGSAGQLGYAANKAEELKRQLPRAGWSLSVLSSSVRNFRSFRERSIQPYPADRQKNSRSHRRNKIALVFEAKA